METLLQSAPGSRKEEVSREQLIGHIRGLRYLQTAITSLEESVKELQAEEQVSKPENTTSET